MDKSQNLINTMRQILHDEVNERYGTSQKHRLVKIFELLPKPTNHKYSLRVKEAMEGWAPDILKLIGELHESYRLKRWYPWQNYYDILRNLFEKRHMLLVCIFFLGRLEIKTGLPFIDKIPDDIDLTEEDKEKINFYNTQWED